MILRSEPKAPRREERQREFIRPQAARYQEGGASQVHRASDEDESELLKDASAMANTYSAPRPAADRRETAYLAFSCSGSTESNQLSCGCGIK